MQGQTHFITGFVSGLTVAQLQGHGLPECAFFAGVGGLAALVPDWLQINIPGVKQIKGLFGHRGFSHWLWMALLMAAIVRPLGIGMAVLAGWVSHIVLDSLSGGVPALWPFGRLTLGHIKTGSETDQVMGSLILICGGILVIRAALRIV